jgi:hypothetical protein
MPREVLSDNYTEQLELTCVRSHGISRDDPTTGPEVTRNSEFVVLFFLGKTPCYERKTFTTCLHRESIR